MTRITVSLGEHDAALLTARALSEARSVSQMARVLIERGLTASEGDEGVAAPAVAAAPPSPREKALRKEAAEAKPMADAASDVDPPTPATLEPTPPPFNELPLDTPPPSVPKRSSIDQVLGDPKHKPKGTVSSRQAVLAAEAARRAAESQDAFSLVCPNRNEHVAGVRCPQCKGIR